MGASGFSPRGSHFKQEKLLDFDTVFIDNWLNDKKYQEMFNTLYFGGFSTKYLTANELKKIQLKAYRDFIFYRFITYLLNPLKLIRKINTLKSICGFFIINQISKNVKLTNSISYICK